MLGFLTWYRRLLPGVNAAAPSLEGADGGSKTPPLSGIGITAAAFVRPDHGRWGRPGKPKAVRGFGALGEGTATEIASVFVPETSVGFIAATDADADADAEVEVEADADADVAIDSATKAGTGIGIPLTVGVVPCAGT